MINTKRDASCVENNMGSEVEVTFCSKDKGEKTCFRWSADMINYISAYKSQMTFMELHFEATKLIIKAELRVIIPELLLKSKGTKLKTMSHDIFFPVNLDEISHVNEN